MGIKLDADEVIGQVFGKLTAIEEVLPVYHKTGRKLRHFLCSCACGKEVVVWIHNLRRGNSTSCGCKKAETHDRNRVPKERKRLRTVWHCMKGRCCIKNNKRYPNYGGRGITVCEEWYDFEVFYNWFLSEQQKVNVDNPSIERIDPSGNYEPSNCTVISRPDQSRNKRKFSKNTSGITGVRETCDGRWIAFWKDEGKTKNKSFSISLYGYETAKFNAIQARKEAIEKLINKGVYYGENHGK